MISPDLAETVKRLRECRCSGDGATLVGYAALMSILDALEGLEKLNRAYVFLVGKIIKALDGHEDDDLSLDENVAKVVSSLAEARKGARTKGMVETCPDNKMGGCAYHNNLRGDWPCHLPEAECPLRAQHPTAPQETAEKEGAGNDAKT